MSEVLHLLFPFSHIPVQTLNYDYEQTIIVPSNYNRKQSVTLTFFDDNQLLPGQSQTTHFIFEKQYLQPKTPPQALTPSNNRQSFQIDHKIHHGFTSAETVLIENALEIVANRLFKPEILQNVYQICGTTGHFLEAGVWSRSKLENNQNSHNAYDLLRYQLMCLKLKSEDGQFPTVDIYPFYEKSDVQAEGTIGCVSCVSHRATFSIKEKFEVIINRYHLNASDENDANAVYWAGVIVHEMLHNLDHNHKSKDYSDHWQINVFQNCFIHNGNYSI